MAIDNKTNANPAAKENEKMFDFAFDRTNYILMISGIIVMGIGYLLMRGGGSDDPNEFSYALFNARRLVVAPLVILAGIIIEIVAIMKKPKKKREKLKSLIPILMSASEKPRSSKLITKQKITKRPLSFYMNKEILKMNTGSTTAGTTF